MPLSTIFQLYHVVSFIGGEAHRTAARHWQTLSQKLAVSRLNFVFFLHFFNSLAFGIVMLVSYSFFQFLLCFPYLIVYFKRLPIFYKQTTIHFKAKRFKEQIEKRINQSLGCH